VPRPLALALVGGMLGEAIETIPEDRTLTDVETSLVELAIQEWTESLIDSQPCSKPLRCRYAGWRRFQDLTRAFPVQEPVVVVRFELSGSFGSATISWLLSQPAVLQFFSHVSECRAAARSAANGLQDVARRIPVQVVIRLGRANVHVADLMNLQPGDILVLDQRVTEPLAAEISGTLKFRGWPGRIGTRQAFQIAGWAKSDEE
jgi:flagellar motor switch protein FliM